jgi:hypothetical protein
MVATGLQWRSYAPPWIDFRKTRKPQIEVRAPTEAASLLRCPATTLGSPLVSPGFGGGHLAADPGHRMAAALLGGGGFIQG